MVAVSFFSARNVPPLEKNPRLPLHERPLQTKPLPVQAEYRGRSIDDDIRRSFPFFDDDNMMPVTEVSTPLILALEFTMTCYSLPSLLRSSMCFVLRAISHAEQHHRGRPCSNGKKTSTDGTPTFPPPDGQSRPRGPSFNCQEGMLVSLGDRKGHLITDSSHENFRLGRSNSFPGKPGNCVLLVHVSTRGRFTKNVSPRCDRVQMNHEHCRCTFWFGGQSSNTITVPDMVERRGPKEKNWGIVGQSTTYSELDRWFENPSASEWK